MVGGAFADEGCAGDLDDGADGVGGDEGPEDRFGAENSDEGGFRVDGDAVAADEEREGIVDGGAKTDRGSHDEEVLDNEVVDAVGVLALGEEPEGVADGFH